MLCWNTHIVVVEIEGLVYNRKNEWMEWELTKVHKYDPNNIYVL